MKKKKKNYFNIIFKKKNKIKFNNSTTRTNRIKTLVIKF